MSSTTHSTAIKVLAEQEKTLSKGRKRVILASSFETVFEWYGFFLYGSLAAIIAKQFFSGVDGATGFVFALLTFAAGFLVRPFGAAFFGNLGNHIGRKYTFLATIIIMGLSTFLVGVLPSYASIGVAAPIALIALRLLQGLALGGEYDAAVTYVAEHAPEDKRGLHTSFVQTTATMGLFLSLLVILGCRIVLGNERFDSWGWRLPFLLSIVLLGMSVWIRMRLNESPIFQQMKNESKTAKSLLRENTPSCNGGLVLAVLIGATAGQAVVWYGGQFYSMFFMTQILKVDSTTTNLLTAVALALAMPFFVFFGWLSDKVGRKRIVLGGCLLAVLTYFPLFKALTHHVNPAIEEASIRSSVTIIAAPNTCDFRFDPIDREVPAHSCDIAAAALAESGIPYRIVQGPTGTVTKIRVGDTRLAAYEDAGLSMVQNKEKAEIFAEDLKSMLITAGYLEKADPQRINKPMTLLILWVLMLYAAMVYGPMAAWLGGIVSGTVPLRLNVATLPLGQRLVRRPSPGDIIRSDRNHRQHVLRPVVSSHRRFDHGCHRHIAAARNQKYRYQPVVTSVAIDRYTADTRIQAYLSPIYTICGGRLLTGVRELKRL